MTQIWGCHGCGVGLPLQLPLDASPGNRNMPQVQLIKNKRLKFKLALLLNTAKFQLSAFQNNKQQKLSILDYTLIFLYSLWQFATIKRKSVNNKGI